MVLIASVVGFIVEYLFCKKRGEAVSEAVFVTAVLFAMVLPPTVPWHVLIIGMIFAVAVSKEFFGGFGRNIFNPALSGRCFVYICFPVAMTGIWAPVAQGLWGALGQWTTASNVEAVTSATPMSHLKKGTLVPTSDAEILEADFDESVVLIRPRTLVGKLFFGRIAGSMGVTSALLILIGGVYLFAKKTASRTTILSVIITYAVLNQILAWAGVPRFYGAAYAVLGGGFLLGAFFMATDPVSSPRTKEGKIIYGVIIAVSTTVIRNFSIFNGGLMFSILLGNMFAPIVDYAVKSFKNRNKTAAKEADE